MTTIENIHTAEVGALLVDIRRRVDHAYDELRARGRQALPLAVEVYHQANTVGRVVHDTLELDGVDAITRDAIGEGLSRLFGLDTLVALLDIIDDGWYSPDDA
jgi:hypothetical protein